MTPKLKVSGLNFPFYTKELKKKEENIKVCEIQIEIYLTRKHSVE